MSAPTSARKGPGKQSTGSTRAAGRSGTSRTSSGREAPRTRSTGSTRSSATTKAPSRPAPRRAAPGGSRSAAAERAYRRKGRRAAVHGTASGALTVGRLSFVAVIIGMLVMGLTLTLLLTTRSAENAYRLGELQDSNRALEHEADSLRREVESARSAPVLARAATELGMVPADNVARLVVGADNAVTVVGEPTPADGTPQPTLVPANGNGEVRLRLTPPSGGSAVVRTPSGDIANEALAAEVNETIPTAEGAAGTDGAAPADGTAATDPATATATDPAAATDPADPNAEYPLTPADGATTAEPTTADPTTADPTTADPNLTDPNATAPAGDLAATESPLTAETPLTAGGGQ